MPILGILDSGKTGNLNLPIEVLVVAGGGSSGGIHSSGGALGTGGGGRQNSKAMNINATN